MSIVGPRSERPGDQSISQWCPVNRESPDLMEELFPQACVLRGARDVCSGFVAGFAW
jgi:hypothetical protein